MSKMLDKAKLASQSYGLAMAQTRFGRPSGVWLECRYCPNSSVIVGSNSAEWMKVSDKDVAGVFRRHGWLGVGDSMHDAHCPDCAPRVGFIDEWGSLYPRDAVPHARSA
jgi:hypothetical protein